MTAAQETKPDRIAEPPRNIRARLSTATRRTLLRAVPPYARYSARQAATAAALQRLENDFEHIRERHSEQIERLEQLVRELVSAAESLRREIARRDGSER
jgi:predicted  nucleic acid-binding Zn-ribbon protein